MAAKLRHSPPALPHPSSRHTPAPSHGGLKLIAVYLSRLCHPSLLATVMPLLVGAHAAGSAGAAWALIPAITAGVIPFLDARRRTGSAGAKSRRQIAAALASIVTGLAITGLAVAAHLAPLPVLAVTAALLAISITITAWRRHNISIHAATAAGCATIGIAEFAPHPVLGAGLGLLAAAVAWSRIVQGHHTTAQSIAGLAAGALTGGVLYIAIT
ncbi:hypothetical protein [Nonomuraea sp. NPDC049709]|uniref:hypothetical protein n=1 Tax=Nonomuraea sp. NPDC049709 TaxID=3154736 RepID=UPI00342C7404